MTFGRGFSFVGNQYHLDTFGVDQYVDLLFFNRVSTVWWPLSSSEGRSRLPT